MAEICHIICTSCRVVNTTTRSSWNRCPFRDIAKRPKGLFGRFLRFYSVKLGISLSPRKNDAKVQCFNTMYVQECQASSMTTKNKQPTASRNNNRRASGFSRTPRNAIPTCQHGCLQCTSSLHQTTMEPQTQQLPISFELSSM